MKNQRLPSLGFTLIEVIVVIVIIGMVSTFAVANYYRTQAIARDGKRVQDLNFAQAALEQYKLANGAYPALKGVGADQSICVLNGNPGTGYHHAWSWPEFNDWPAPAGTTTSSNYLIRNKYHLLISMLGPYLPIEPPYVTPTAEGEYCRYRLVKFNDPMPGEADFGYMYESPVTDDFPGTKSAYFDPNCTKNDLYGFCVGQENGKGKCVCGK